MATAVRTVENTVTTSSAYLSAPAVKALRKALTALQPIVTHKRNTTLPVLSAVHMINGFVTGTDLNSATVITLPVNEHGPMVIDLKDLLLAVKSAAASNSDMGVEYRDNGDDTAQCTITVGNAKYSAKAYALDAYPDMPGIHDSVTIAATNGVMLREALIIARDHASIDTTRGVLQSIALDLHGDTITVVGTDAYRIAVIERPNSVHQDSAQIITITPSGIAAMLAMLPSKTDYTTDQNATLTLHNSSNILRLTCGVDSAVIVLRHETYVNYRQILTAATLIASSINAAKLIDAIEPSAKGRDGCHLVTLATSQGDDRFLVSAYENFKDSYSTRDIKLTERTLLAESIVYGSVDLQFAKVGLNACYITDAIKHAGKHCPVAWYGDDRSDKYHVAVCVNRFEYATDNGNAVNVYIMPVTVPK